METSILLDSHRWTTTAGRAVMGASQPPAPDTSHAGIGCREQGSGSFGQVLQAPTGRPRYQPAGDKAQPAVPLGVHALPTPLQSMAPASPGARPQLSCCCCTSVMQAFC